MGHLRSLAKQTAIYGISNVLIRFINFLVTPWFTRIFPRDDYGIYIELYAYIAVLQIILTYGLETGFFRFAGNAQNEKKYYSTILTSIISSSLIFVVAFIFFKEQVNNIFHYQNSEIFIWFAIINAVDAVSAVPLARLRMENKAVKYGLIRIGEVIFTVLLILFFYVVCKNAYINGSNNIFASMYDSSFPVKHIFVANAFASVFKLLLLSRLLNIKFRIDFSAWKQVVFYSIPLMLAGLPGVLNDLLDRIMLRYLLPGSENQLEQLGIYGACLKIAVIISIFTQVFRYGAEPFYFRIAKEKDAKAVFADVMKYFVIASLFICVFIALYLDAFKYLIGNQFREGLHVVPVLLMAYMFFGIQYNLSVWYKLSDLTKYALRITALGITVNILLLILLVPNYGYTGAAWAKLFSFIVMVVHSYMLGQKHYPVNYQTKRIVAYIIVAAVVVIASGLIKFENSIFDFVFRTCILCVLFAVVYKVEKLNVLIKRFFAGKN